MKSLSALIIVFAACAGQAVSAPPPATLVDVNKIWDQAPHSAFTDLIRWNDQFICAFREGRGHASSDGKIRVLSSADGTSWESAALVELAGYDLRDAGLSVAPDGQLMLIGGAAPRPKDDEIVPTGTFVAFSGDGTTWTPPKIVLPPGRWLWRVTWHGGKAFGVSYAAPEGHPFASLLTSSDGTQYSELVPQLLGDGYPTEAVLRVDDKGVMYCLQRRDVHNGASSSNSAFFGVSEPPYTQWQWHDLKIHLGGPSLIQIPSGAWIAAGRIHRDGGPKTEVAALDVERRSLQRILQLPSGGDTSYPGLVWHDDTLLISYYSSHEGKSSIYLAKVHFP